MHFYDEGNGPPLVLLHGLGSSGADWLLQIQALKAQFRLLAPDLRGHGQSPMPTVRLTIADFATDVIALLDQLQIEKADFVGLSLGGAVAQQITLAAPQRVHQLVLVNTAAHFKAYQPATLLRGAQRLALMRLVSMEAMSRAVAQALFPAADQAELRSSAAQRLAEGNPRAYQATLLALARFDVRHRLHEIHCPTLVMVGRNDRTVPMAARLYLASHIPQARLALVSHSGHATPIDQPQVFNQLVASFLSAGTALR